MRLLYGAKVLVPLFLCVLVPISGVTHQLSPFYAYVLALAIGLSRCRTFGWGDG